MCTPMVPEQLTLMRLSSPLNELNHGGDVGGLV